MSRVEWVWDRGWPSRAGPPGGRRWAGGRSSGTWRVTGGHGEFNGTVVNVPSLSAPGFIKAAADGTYPDVSDAIDGALVLTVRTSTPKYAGFRVSFASGTMSPDYACAGGGTIPLSRGCFKAAFAVPSGGEFVDVAVPFASFSDMWSPSTGNQTKTCASDPSVCPSRRALAHIQRFEVWAEGFDGDVHLDIQEISARGPASRPAAHLDVCMFVVLGTKFLNLVGPPVGRSLNLLHTCSIAHASAQGGSVR